MDGTFNLKFFVFLHKSVKCLKSNSNFIGSIVCNIKAALGYLDGEYRIFYSCNGIVISETFILTSNAPMY